MSSSSSKSSTSSLGKQGQGQEHLLPDLEFADSHCHLQMLESNPDFGSDLHSVLQTCLNNQVKHLLCVGVIVDELQEILSICERHSSHEGPIINASVGQHPNEQIENEPTVETLMALAKHPKVLAIGETGLDYFRSDSDNRWQKDRFRNHIAAAIQVKKPIIIHSRAARKDTLEILQQEKAYECGGVFHCFTEDWDTAKRGMDLGFYISFSGIVTFKNATELQDIVKKMPLDRLLIETDSPYLAPVPHRGKINQPAYVRHVAEFIAELRGEPLEKIAENTTGNFKTLFYGGTGL